MTDVVPPATEAPPRQYGRGAAASHPVAAILIIFLLLQGFSMAKRDPGELWPRQSPDPQGE